MLKTWFLSAMENSKSVSDTGYGLRSGRGSSPSQTPGESPISVSGRPLYSPLPPGRWFRILSLLPGAFDDPIRCELDIIELDVKPSYEAISYCWGDSTQTKEISCNGHPLDITVSLFGALRRFRLEARERFLWADSICINQASVDEKAHQVPLMEPIYAQGRGTLIWLGDSAEDETVKRGMGLLKDVNQYMQAKLDAMDRSKHSNIAETLNAVSLPPSGHPLLEDETGWKGICAILEKPYFQRLWVQQEVGLFAASTLFLGENSIPMTEVGRFSVLCRAMTHVLAAKASFFPLMIISESLQILWSTFRLEKSWMKDGSILEEFAAFAADQASEELNIFKAGRTYQATLGIDHIYGVLGHPLTKVEGQMPLIDVDYNRSLEETSVVLAEALCLTADTQPLSLLCYADHFSHPNVPSWVPLWHLRGLYNVIGSRKGLDASMWNDLDVRKNTVRSFSEPWQTRKLRVAALLLGDVTSCSEPFSGDLSGGTSEVPQVIQDAWRFYESHATLPESDPSFWSSFLTTLLMTNYGLILVAADFLDLCRSHDSTFHLVERLHRHPWFSQERVSRVEASRARLAGYINLFTTNKRMFATVRGDLGLSLKPAAPGDVLAVVFGCPLPVLLKPTENMDCYQMVGTAWVERYALGDAVKQWRNGNGGIEHREVFLI